MTFKNILSSYTYIMWCPRITQIQVPFFNHKPFWKEINYLINCVNINVFGYIFGYICFMGLVDTYMEKRDTCVFYYNNAQRICVCAGLSRFTWKLYVFVCYFSSFIFGVMCLFRRVFYLISNKHYIQFVMKRRKGRHNVLLF